MPEELRNLTNQEILKKRLAEDPTPRKTISFYKYAAIADPQEFRDQLFRNLSGLGVLGRIYVAKEGINAQISLPEANFESFKSYLYSCPFLDGIRLNIAIDDDGKSFWVLHIKVKEKIVADGIDDPAFTIENRGTYLSAKQFNELSENPETVVVDMRNYYEFEVGHFENAIEVPSDTFREQLPMAAEMLEDKRDKPIIMYCTGGIRCEKASAYLLYKGFRNVHHLEGGIIEYARKVKEENLENKFRGKNFVFDDRLGERITDDIISNCHQCGAPSDDHTNCANTGCHLLFIQCAKCRAAMEGCCSIECKRIHNLPEEDQREWRKGKHIGANHFNNSSKRPRPLGLKISEAAGNEK